MKGAPQVRPAAAGGGPAAPLVAPRRPRGAPTGPPQVRIDSRILARRREVAREESRRRLRRLLWLGGSVALVALVLGATRTPLLDLDRVDVAPAGSELAGSELAADELAEVQDTLAGAGIQPGVPLVDVDLTAGEQALEDLPWVARAEVARRWPGTLVVEVDRRVPVAAVATAAGAALVDRDGQVVALAPTTTLVAVEGPADLGPGDRLDAGGLLAVAEAVPASLAPLVDHIGPGDGPSVLLHLRAGGVVDLGPPLGADDVADKLHAAVTMLTQVDTSCLRELDVSVPSVPTVTRVPGC